LKKTKEFLKENRDLLVTIVDKGNATVIIKSSEYVQRMEDLLKDRTTYKIIKDDPTNKLQKKSNKYIRKLRNMKI